MKRIASAFCIIALAMGSGAAAHAESNQLSAVEAPQGARTIQGGVILGEHGSEAYPVFASDTALSSPPMAVATSGDGPLQTLASLPHEFHNQPTAIASRGRTSPAS